MYTCIHVYMYTCIRLPSWIITCLVSYKKKHVPNAVCDIVYDILQCSSPWNA